MTALTAAWSPDPATSVTLDVTQHPDGPVTILRTDATGTRPVRGVPDAIAGAATVTDHEPALHGAVSYACDGATASLAQPTRAAAAYLQRAGEPGSVTPVTVLTDGPAWETGATLHEVLDRADPAVILHPMRTRTGTLQLVAHGTAAALDAARLGDAAVLQLRTACADLAPLSCYLLVTNARATPVTEHLLAGPWRVELDYREVGMPAGGTLGASWTYAAVAQRFTDYAAVAATFRTYRDLTAGA